MNQEQVPLLAQLLMSKQMTYPVLLLLLLFGFWFFCYFSPTGKQH